MLRKLFAAAGLFLSLSLNAVQAIEYEVNDIGTLQTHSSEAIDLNNHGQILGWYNVDGSEAGKHFFVRDRDGMFHEFSGLHRGKPIEWKWIKDNGKAYGFYYSNLGNHNNVGLFLFAWDVASGVVELGKLPGSVISAINNKGQVLIQSVHGSLQNGMGSAQYPVIWDNGRVTNLYGLEGELGSESVESYGYDLNDDGDVVGKCLVDVVYKNRVSKQFHAVVWKKGIPKDLHKKAPKSKESWAPSINNSKQLVMHCTGVGSYVYDDESDTIKTGVAHVIGNKYCMNVGGFGSFYDLNCNPIFDLTDEQKKLSNDYSSVWLCFKKLVKINDAGAIIANVETVYDECHAVIITPKEEQVSQPIYSVGQKEKSRKSDIQRQAQEALCQQAINENNRLRNLHFQRFQEAALAHANALILAKEES